MQIDWWTLVLQVINFLVLVWLSWRFLYQPVKEVIQKRKQLAEHAFAEAEKRRAEAESERQRFEESQAGLAQERQEMLKKVHAELEAERIQILDKARASANDILDKAREATAKEREAAMGEIREDVAALAAELASSLLRQAGPGGPDSVLLERLEKQMNGLPDGERERLRKDLEPAGARLTVVTAVPLKANERARWVDQLGACLGHGNKTDFVTDPEILGGVEVRFPHAVLKSTWADHLRKAEEQIRGDESAS
ncbi:MAG: F0F1 ATP synthase subunit delta [Methyloceanibacter sp.]|jgi:F-type H+-transporting ATPase subunit b